MHEAATIVGVLLTAAGALYALCAAAVMRGPSLPVRTPPTNRGAFATPVTVLKALCGAEPGLYEQLRSFCHQHYEMFQLVFGVQDAADPALQVVQRLREEHPGLDIAVVVDATLHGCNRKISNLMNMLPHARHALLVMADSDIVVSPDYLARVVAPLADPAVGLVTCAYFGRTAASPEPPGAAAGIDGPACPPRPAARLASRLGAMFINDWFMPSVLLAARFGSRSFVSGATIAMRAEALAAVGGLRRLADQLADDYRLGELVREHGLAVVLSDMTVVTTVSERGLGSLCRHELRWLRTIQSAQPLGYACCFPSFALPTAVVGAALAQFGAVATALLAITAAARLVLHYFAGRGSFRRRWADVALLPLRDALLAVLWIWSFRRREIVWREQRFGIGQDGSLHRVG
jgi:ceramide glucosyltransferase